MKIERNILISSAVAALTLGVLGVALAMLCNSRAILLDGLFNLAYFLAAVFTLKVSSLVRRPEDEAFPFGYGYFDSLINGVRGLLVLGISALALVDTAITIAEGGRRIEAELAIAYGIAAVAVCTVTAYSLYLAYRRTHSALVRADLQNWMVNATISCGVLVAFIAIPVMEQRDLEDVVPYVDPGLVAFVVLVCLAVPIRIAWRALMELFHRAPPESVSGPVTATIREALAGLPARKIHVRMARMGRTIYASVHVVLPRDHTIDGLAALDAIRKRLDGALRLSHPNVIADLMFTAEERWAEPVRPMEKP
jgi:cation diffusion facilitator family transporter